VFQSFFLVVKTASIFISNILFAHHKTWFSAHRVAALCELHTALFKHALIPVLHTKCFHSATDVPKDPRLEILFAVSTRTVFYPTIRAALAV